MDEKEEKPTPNPSQDFGVSAQSNEGNKSDAAGDKGKANYENECQQNLIKVIEYLAKDVFRPVTTQEVMDALGISKNKAHWTLHNLKIGGWAEQIASGWRLSPDLVKIADSVRATLKEVMHRYL